MTVSLQEYVRVRLLYTDADIIAQELNVPLRVIETLTRDGADLEEAKRLEAEAGAIDMALDGKTTREIAQEVGMTYQHIYYLLRSVGLSTSERGKSVQEEEAICQAYLSDMRVADILRSTGITSNSLYEILDKYQVPLRRERSS